MNKKNGVFLVLIAFCYPAHGQDSLQIVKSNLFQRHEINLDVATILTFLKRDVQSYALYHRYQLTKKSRLRNAVTFSYSDQREKGLYIDYVLGIDRTILKSSKFDVYYGPDISFSYSKTNYQPNRNYRFGLSPFIGFRYNISKYFSLSTEPHLNFFMHVTRNPDSFDPSANRENYETSIGTVGLVLIGFHF